MKWLTHKGLAENDLEKIAGSELMSKLMLNRLVIALDPTEKVPSTEDLGLFETKGVFHYRTLQGRNDTIEILFELADDMEATKEALVICKMRAD